MAAVKVEEVATVLRLISLAAAISIAEGKEGDEAEQEKEPTELYFFVVVHTMKVAPAMVFSAGYLEGWSKDMEEFFRRIKDLIRSRSHPGEPEEIPRELEEEEGEVSLEGRIRTTH